MNDEKLAQIPRVDVRKPFDGARWNALANVFNGHRAADLTLVDADGAPLIASDPTAKTVGIAGTTTADANGIQTGNVEATGTQRHTGAGVVTPAQITANTNDYTPTGLASARVLRLSTNASRNLTGIVAQPTGTVLSLCNVGASDLVLVHESGASLAANRFVLPGSANLTLTANGAAQLIYDGTSARWRSCA